MNLPEMYRIRQRFDDIRVKDIRETVRAELGGVSWSAIFSPEKAAVLMHFGNDRKTIEIALRCIGSIPAAKSKIVRIKNTLRLDSSEVSEAYAEMLQQRPDLEIISGPDVMVFNSENNLPWEGDPKCRVRTNCEAEYITRINRK